MWHPTRNQGKQPADFTSGSRKRVWFLCPGCKHGCGRKHEWEARVDSLTRSGGRIVCPFCESNKCFCQCQSVAADPRLSKEWHPDNPPAIEVAKNSNTKYLWKCPEGHQPYLAFCYHRSVSNTGCPECAQGRSRKRFHPVLSVGRPDLAEEWDDEMNDKSPSEVTLGSTYKAWWRCRDDPEHIWQARVSARVKQGSGCPACKSANRSKPRKLGPSEHEL